MQLRAVILDYGEVISRTANPAIHNELLEIAGARGAASKADGSAPGLTEELFEKLYWAHRLDHDAAILDGRMYWQKIAEGSGVEFTPAQIDRLIERDARMWMDINEPMLAWTAQLKRSGLRTAILSNIGDGVLHAMRRDFLWLAEFDKLIWSCELGVVKPDTAIYLHAVHELGVKPEEALFIDNLPQNIAGAEAAGLRGIVFKDMEQLSREIVRRGLGLPLPQGAATL